MSKTLEYFKETHTNGEGKYYPSNFKIGDLSKDKRYWLDTVGPVVIQPWMGSRENTWSQWVRIKERK